MTIVRDKGECQAGTPFTIERKEARATTSADRKQRSSREEMGGYCIVHTLACTHHINEWGLETPFRQHLCTPAKGARHRVVEQYRIEGFRQKNTRRRLTQTQSPVAAHTHSNKPISTIVAPSKIGIKKNMPTKKAKSVVTIGVRRNCNRCIDTNKKNIIEKRNGINNTKTAAILSSIYPLMRGKNCMTNTDAMEPIKKAKIAIRMPFQSLSYGCTGMRKITAVEMVKGKLKITNNAMLPSTSGKISFVNAELERTIKLKITFNANGIKKMETLCQ